MDYGSIIVVKISRRVKGVIKLVLRVDEIIVGGI